MSQNPNQNYGIEHLAGPSILWDKTLSPVKKWFKVLVVIIVVPLAAFCVLKVIEYLFK